MDSENVHEEHPADQTSSISIPVQSKHVDKLITIARDLAGLLLILDAAGTGDPTLAAVARMLSPINEQLQEFKRWFHDACRLSRSENNLGNRS